MNTSIVIREASRQISRLPRDQILPIVDIDNKIALADKAAIILSETLQQPINAIEPLGVCGRVVYAASKTYKRVDPYTPILFHPLSAQRDYIKAYLSWYDSLEGFSQIAPRS